MHTEAHLFSVPNDCLWYDKLWGPSQRVVTLFRHHVVKCDFTAFIKILSAENTGHLVQADSSIVLGDCNEHCASSMENILLNIPPKPF